MVTLMTMYEKHILTWTKEVDIALVIQCQPLQGTVACRPAEGVGRSDSLSSFRQVFTNGNLHSHHPLSVSSDHKSSTSVKTSAKCLMKALKAAKLGTQSEKEVHPWLFHIPLWEEFTNSKD